MKKVILMVFVLIGLTLNAQLKKVVITDKNNKVIEIGYLNEKNQRDSLWIDYDENGNVSSEIEYRNGKKSGICRIYNDEGDIVFKILYVNGKKRKGKQWDDKGHLIDSRTWDSEEVLVAEYKRYYH